MAYGTIKVDTITFTDGGVDKSVSVSGLVENPTFTGNVTATGTISGDILRGQTISGVTVTGTTANFTSGNFTNISGGTHTITSGVFALGTAANPSISFVSDPNSGLYSPGADQVAISTNGTGRLFINSAGNVGIGAAPGHALDVNGQVQAKGQIYLTDSSGNDVIRFTEIGSRDARMDAFNGTDFNGTLRYAGANLIFETGTGASVSERMRLDSSGRLGLGTSAPAKKLEVQEGDVQIQNLNSALNTLSNYGLTFRSINPGGQDRGTIAEIKTYTGGASDNDFGLQFRTQATTAGGVTTKMTLTPAGSLGIGTTSPAVPLDQVGDHIVRSTTTNTTYVNVSGGADVPRLEFYNSGVNTFNVGYRGASAPATQNIAEIRVAANSPLVLFTNNTERARIDSSGRLGLGTSGPAADLDFGGAVGDTKKIRFSMGGNVASIGSVGSGVANGLGNLTFFTRDGSYEVAAMTIDGAQRVGIGTNSATELLSVNGNLWLGNGGGSGGAEMLRIWNDGGVERIHASNNPSALAFGIGGSAGTNEAFRVDTNKRLLVGTSTSPSAGQGQYAKLVVQGNSSGTTAGIFNLQATSAAGSVASGDDVGFINFTGNDGNTFAWIRAQADGTTGTNDFPGRLVFSTTADGASSPTERVRINQQGTMGVFCTASTAGVFGTSAAAGTSAVVFACRHSASSTTAGTDAMYVYSNGNIVNTNNSYGAISDIKLKENIVNANSQWNDLKALQVRNYNFKEGQTHTQIGLVAQEVELVSPGLVSESPDRDAEGNDLGTVTKSVNYSVLYMKAVKALQEAMERIETLEAKVAALEAV